MAKHEINAGATSQRFYIYLQDSTTGQGETGVTSATCYYLRDSVSGAMPAAVTLTFGAVFASPGTYPAWTSGGVREIGYMPGLYLIDIPNAVFAVGARNAVVQIFPTSGTPWLPVNLEFTLAAVNIYDSVRMGMTALPNVAQGNTGAISTGNASGQVTVATNNDKTGYSLTQTFPANFNLLAINGSGAVTAGTVSDKTGYSLTQTFPTNFNLLAINGSGAVTAGTVSDKTGYSLSVAPPTAAQIWATDVSGYTTAGQAGTYQNKLDAAITTRMASFTYTAPLNSSQTASAVWDALLASYTVNNSFGQRVLRSTTSQSTCAVTGSNHIAADIHELQAGVITATDFSAGAINANALATDAVTEITTATWTVDPSLFATSTAGYWLYQSGLNSQSIISDTNVMTGSPYIESIGDALLNRNIASGSNTGRLVKEALYALRNKSEIVGSTLNVYNATDGAIAWTATVASSASADPVTGIDPA